MFKLLSLSFHIETFKMAPVKRTSFSKELRLKIIEWQYQHDRNISATSGTDRKQTRGWAKEENKFVNKGNIQDQFVRYTLQFARK